MLARERGLAQSMAISFDRHPRTVFDKDFVPNMLTTVDERRLIMSRVGVDVCAVLRFDKEMASMSADDFMKEILHKQLGVRLLLLGYDNRFGRKNKDEGFEDYVRYGKAIGIEVVECDPFEISDGKRVSSTLVRELLADGRVDEAAECLGHPYSVEGTVVEGFHEGRKIGFPTANLDIDPLKIIPVGGVYAVKVRVEGDMQLHHGMMNIGHRPTYGVNELTLETNIFRFRENIYGKKIRVEFCKKLRNEHRFDTISELARQLSEDAFEANEYLMHPDALPLTRRRFFKANSNI
jgi:riboflavin kinase/FMN adenylyltransferase